MSRKVLFAIIIFLVSSLSFFFVMSAGQYFRIKGSFTPDDIWTAGHPGKVTFDIGTSYSGSAAMIDTDGYLTGVFWVSKIGWVRMDHQEWSVERARIVCPDTVFRDTSIVCPATGFVWSQNGGWIALSGSFIDGGSGVYYNPARWVLEGFGHSSALGYIPFYAYAASPVDSGALDQTGITFDGVSVNFIGKIAVIGNIAGSRIYNMTNQNVWYVFSNISQSAILNTIRKNISLLSRNIPTANLISGNGTNFIYQKGQSFDYDTSFGWIWPTGKRSIIIEGRDIILNQSLIGDPTDTHPRAIIALKDANGNGGNIIITKNVNQIYAFIYAEGSIYSWEKTVTTDPITSYIASGAWNIPAQQIYIKWGIISKNTIGGSLQTPSVCPVVISNCTTLLSQVYDLNYFRTYDYTDPTQKSVPFTDVRFEKSSMVVDFNSAVSADPPPGLDSVIQ